MRRAGLRRAGAPLIAALLLGALPLAAQEPASPRPVPRASEALPAAEAPGLSDAASDLAGPAAALPAPAAPNGAADAPLRLAPSAAAPGADPRALAVVIVDQEALYRQSRWGMRAQAELAAQSRQVAADNDRAFADLVADEDALTAARARLSPEEFRIRATEFDERVMAIRRERDEAREALSDTAERDRAIFFQAAAPVLGRVMVARGALVMLDQRMVLIAEDRVDVTDDAIAALNAELGDGREIIAAALKAQAEQERAQAEAEKDTAPPPETDLDSAIDPGAAAGSDGAAADPASTVPGDAAPAAAPVDEVPGPASSAGSDGTADPAAAAATVPDDAAPVDEAPGTASSAVPAPGAAGSDASDPAPSPPEDAAADAAPDLDASSAPGAEAVSAPPSADSGPPREPGEAE
ncbi:OmpH family outer membrane protein [Paracoccus solventivorans]|uniref:OmpH family outer membrane protein n=1 Tax=Paracoccus solventivorans TaxID=53463 RepID=UPI0026F07E5E|nr:OmpH family outer membrane protein [Paracoccus solventivorans]